MRFSLIHVVVGIGSAWILAFLVLEGVKRYGALGGIGGAICGVGAALLLTRLAGWVLAVWLFWSMRIPRCETGRCSRRDCRLLEGPDKNPGWECRCGNSYVLLLGDGRFMKRDSTGVLIPFMRKNACGLWVKDDGKGREARRSRPNG